MTDSLERFRKELPRWQWRNDRVCERCRGLGLLEDEHEVDADCDLCPGSHGMRYECEPDILERLRLLRIYRKPNRAAYTQYRARAYDTSADWIEYSVAETFAMTPRFTARDYANQLIRRIAA